MISVAIKDGSGTGSCAKVDPNDNSLITYSSGFINGTNSTVTVSSLSSQIIDTNLQRKYMYISNQSGGTVYLLFQIKINEVAIIGGGIALSNNSIYEINHNNLWLGAIQAIKSGSSGSLYIFEGTS